MIFTSVEHASYTATRPDTVFYSVRHNVLTDVDEDYALSAGEGLRTFRWNEVPSSSTVGPEDEDKMTSRQDETSQMT